MLQTDSKLKLKAAVDSLTEDELRTYAALRSWRDATAEMAGLPPFRVMYEAVAVAVVKAAPADAKALRAVRGVGPKFEELYGPSVLECLAAERALRARGVGGEQELELEGRSSGGERVAAVQLGSGG
jgi:ribonuclease D